MLHQKCTYVEVVVYFKNTSAWNKHLIKVKRVLRISYFPLLVMISRPIKPHFAELIPPTRAEITDRISVQILHYLLFDMLTHCKCNTHKFLTLALVYKKEMRWPGGLVGTETFLYRKGHRFYPGRQPLCIHQKPFILSKCPSARHWTASCSPTVTPTDSHIS